jgi:uncharacterized protein (TIRG00374 family)
MKWKYVQLMSKTTFKALLKIFFSLVILAILFHEVHIKEVLPYLKNIHVGTFALCLVVLFTGNIIATLRWSLIMSTLGAPKASTFYLKTYLTGLMFNQILPSSIGGDGYRMIEVTKLGITKRLAITSVLADRIIGFSGLVILSLLALPAAYHLLPQHIFLGLAALTACCTAAIFCVYILRFIKVKLFEKYFRWFYDLSNTFAASFSSPRDLSIKLIMSLMTNFSAILSFYFIARALGIPCHAIDFIIIIPIVNLVMMIPISMAGWGIREGAMIYFGALVGLSQPAALAISLMSGLTLIINSGPGFYFYFIEKSSALPAPNNSA